MAAETGNAGKYIPPCKRKSTESQESEGISKTCQPSNCHCHKWLKAYNSTLYNNAKLTIHSGKWLIFTVHEQVDNIWSKISINTEQGNLGPVSSVSTKMDREGDEQYTHVISVYTYDSGDVGDIMRARQVLRRLGFIDPLNYKTNMDTANGIYRAKGHKHISKYVY